MTPSRISDDVKASVHAAHDIVELVGCEVELKRRGRYFVGLCPFHEERTPSFNVDPVRQTFKCFGGCGEQGDAIDWIQKRRGVSFWEAVRALAAEKGIRVDDVARPVVGSTSTVKRSPPPRSRIDAAEAATFWSDCLKLGASP